MIRTATRSGNRPVIKVLVIDDSALVRMLLADILNSDPDIEVVDTASDAIRGLEKIANLKPDVITLDIDMPRLDGLSMLDRLMPLWPLPVVMISALTRDGADATLKALELGAVDFIPKPLLDIRLGFEALRGIVVSKVKLAAEAKVRQRLKPIEAPAPHHHITAGRGIVAIGASTGGVAALNFILPQLEADAPAIVIAQHMPPVFTQQFARRLNGQCSIAVVEASDGQTLLPGHAYIAPGDRHLEVVRSGASLKCHLRGGPLVNGHMPSVDVLFKSVAETVGRNALGILLTGMGRDGAQGLLEMRTAGASTACQDEATSLIYGMPQAAIQLAAAQVQLPLSAIPDLITSPRQAHAKSQRAVR
jgi:two-component system, chemotaxis family, protein-glutamate methylesterase/glutaminase